MEQWLQTLGESSLRAIVFAAGIAAILSGLRIKPAAARHAAWTIALAAMLALPIATAWLPQVPLRVLPRRAIPESEVVPFPTPYSCPVPARLSPEEARALEAKVRSDLQDDLQTYKLLSYYEHNKDAKSSSRLVLWAIEHQPASRLAGYGIDPAEDRDGYERGKQLLTSSE